MKASARPPAMGRPGLCRRVRAQFIPIRRDCFPVPLTAPGPARDDAGPDKPRPLLWVSADASLAAELSEDHEFGKAHPLVVCLLGAGAGFPASA